MTPRRSISREHLESMIADGEVDTVIMAFPDLQGRLVGKRTVARFFLEHVADDGTENCDYLIATDLDDQALPGFRFASYDQGYGDMLARADWSTVRLLPWMPGTALVMCDLVDPQGDAIDVAPRRILARQVEQAAELGLVPMVASELEFHLYRNTYEAAWAADYRELTPSSPWLQDYQLLSTSRDEPFLAELRHGLEGAGVPVEFTKGEAGRGQHEVNLAYAEGVEMADRNALYKQAVKELAARHACAATFMAKVSMEDTGSSGHLHLSLWDAAREQNLLQDPAAPHGMSELFQQFLAGLLATAADLTLLWAPYVNSYKRFQPDSWAPTAIGWGIDNRTLGFRVVGHGPSMRMEIRVPGADVNSYLAFAAAIAGGLYGVREGLDLPPPHPGNGYTATDLPRIPTTLPEALACWDASDVVRSLFGDDVHHHLSTSGHHEWAAFGRCVTDWERRRYFERA